MDVGAVRSSRIDSLGRNISDKLLSIKALDEQQTRIRHKTEAAHALVRQKHQAQRLCDEISSEISKAQVLAFVNDDGADVRALEKKLIEAEKQLSSAESEAVSAEHALELLAEKSAKNTGLIRALQAELSKLEREWLKARQDVLFEEFRLRFDSLKDTVALLLASEVHPSFDDPNSIVTFRPGTDLLERLASALPYNGPRNYTPTWVHVSNRSGFPGFSAAEKILAAEIAQLTAPLENAP